MSTERALRSTHPAGDHPLLVVVDTFGGRIHGEWEAGRAAVTPLDQLPFFLEYLKQGGLFDGWVASCPLYLTSPNVPSKRGILGTVLLLVYRYSHITTLRCDSVTPLLLGMTRVMSETAVHRALGKIEVSARWSRSGTSDTPTQARLGPDRPDTHPAARPARLAGVVGRLGEPCTVIGRQPLHGTARATCEF